MKESAAAPVLRTCPHCGLAYSEPPALSRSDDQTMVCPDCGIREALASLGCGPEEQEAILAIVHRFKREE